VEYIISPPSISSIIYIQLFSDFSLAFILNLLVIPIENLLFYVEPIFLKSESAQLPEIKRILVAMGDNIQWAENFYSAIDKIYAKLPDKKPEVIKKQEEKPKEELIKETINEIERLLKKIKKML
jgi:uncharacterized membrane protein (UPF0182 family)